MNIWIHTKTMDWNMVLGYSLTFSNQVSIVFWVHNLIVWFSRVWSGVLEYVSKSSLFLSPSKIVVTEAEWTLERCCLAGPMFWSVLIKLPVQTLHLTHLTHLTVPRPWRLPDTGHHELLRALLTLRSPGGEEILRQSWRRRQWSGKWLVGPSKDLSGEERGGDTGTTPVIYQSETGKLSNYFVLRTASWRSPSWETRSRGWRMRSTICRQVMTIMRLSVNCENFRPKKDFYMLNWRILSPWTTNWSLKSLA